MAIEVVKRGTPPKEKPFRVVCGHCYSTLKFLESDAQKYDDGRCGTYYQIDCPVCGRRISADDHDRMEEKGSYSWYDR